MAAPNNHQKLALFPNDANLINTLNNYLQQGYVIHQIINLAPVSNNLLIVYYDPAVDNV